MSASINQIRFVPLRGSSPGSQRGQSVVFALLALLILSFVGALFIGIVTKNLGTTGHSSQVTNADFFARAGLDFADQQLTTSQDGADWRPPSQNVSPDDPDSDLVNQGFTRFSYGSGRFLLKVIYDPVDAQSTPGLNPSPLNRYIKIESVGRVGVVDPTDPTTFIQGQHPLNDTLIGYKQIGLTDYARFVTDPDNTGQVATIGVPSVLSTTAGGNLPITPGVIDFTDNTTSGVEQLSVPTNLGARDAYTVSGGVLSVNPTAGTGKPTANPAVPGGGSFRSNDPVRFYGICNFWLDRDISALPAINTEGVEIAGDILQDNFNSKSSLTTPAFNSVTDTFTTGIQSSLVNANVATNTSGAFASNSVMPSNWSGSTSPFSTYGGAVRDGGSGSNSSDAYGLPRSIKRLPPPSMNEVDPLSSLPRYKAITTTSINWDAAVWAGSGTPQEAGYGVYTYINNYGDTQSEEATPLPNLWLNQTNPPGTTFWHNNDVYDPPGVKIHFSAAGYTITRSDVDRNSNPILFPNSVGSTAYVAGDPGQVLNVAYGTIDPIKKNNDIIIYAEGNVRLSGVVSAVGDAHNVTVITNGTAYIDGSLLKGDPDSSIAVLAHDYVCVNTTQFLAGPSALPLLQTATLPDTYVQPQYTDAKLKPVTNAFTSAGTVPNTVTVSVDPGGTGSASTILQEFTFGLAGGGSPGTNYTGPGTEHLYLSAQTTVLPNPPTVYPAEPLVNILNESTGAILSTIPLGTISLIGPATTTMTHNTYPIAGLAAQSELPLMQFELQVPPNNSGPNPNTAIVVERAAVLPADIRIEAILFAQTKSFFVIPGPWFNTTSIDNLQNFVPPGTGSLHTLAATDQNRYPFYGQPIDMKITIAGSVVEGHTADPGAQGAWMQHWGWIPQFHGSRGDEPAGHNYSGTILPDTSAIPGLTIIYDPSAGYPYDKLSPNKVINGKSYRPYLRYDGNANPLPFAPKLPVCPGYIYIDEISGQTPVS